jgi:8-oxo-dGTP diphosphatase
MSRGRVVFAAGGILWRGGPEGPLVAIVHRPRYGDWVLPKGKLDPGERWQEAALREVREETGYDLLDLAGVACYQVAEGFKVVLFWNALARGDPSFVPGEEVDRMEWLAPAAALTRLDHADERDILARQAPPPGVGS